MIPKSNSETRDTSIIDTAAHAIQRRAHLYVGPVEDPLTATHLLVSVLDQAIADGKRGDLTQLVITLQPSDMIFIRTVGKAWPNDIMPDGRRRPEHWLTNLYAGSLFDVNPNTPPNIGIVSAMALSHFFIFGNMCASEKYPGKIALWKCSFHNGEQATPYAEARSETWTGTDLLFSINSNFIPKTDIDLPTLVKALEEVKRPKGFSIVIYDRRTESGADIVIS